MKSLMIDLLNPLWRFLMGGCSMTRDVEATIVAAGEWEDLGGIKREENAWTTFPRVHGVLVKPVGAGGGADK
jgi:hypothetical protein